MGFIMLLSLRDCSDTKVYNFIVSISVSAFYISHRHTNKLIEQIKVSLNISD